MGRFWWDDSPLDDPRMAGDGDLATVLATIDWALCVPPNTLLPRFARYVKDFDWNSFYGFGHDPGPATAVHRRLWGGKLREWPADAEVQFQCVDGAFWCLFTRDPGLLDTVASHAAAQAGWSARRLVWGGTWW
ncbi:MAG: hypothetical protein ACRC7O_07310 [Fimbriiglobus sp.]